MALLSTAIFMLKLLIPECTHFFMHNTLFTTGMLSSSSLSASQLGSRQASRQTICYLQPYWEMQISSTTGTFSYWHKIKRWTMSILSNHFPILYLLLHSKKGLFTIECWLFDINGYQIWSCFVRWWSNYSLAVTNICWQCCHIFNTASSQQNLLSFLRYI